MVAYCSHMHFAVVLQACALALTSAVGAPWVTKPGPVPNVPIPILDGIAPTTHVTSTECGNDCAFVNPKLWATAAVSEGQSMGEGAVIQAGAHPMACSADTSGSVSNLHPKDGLTEGCE